MGIPSYFSSIIKDYPHIIKKLVANGISVENFFIDSNSIVYDCARCVDFAMFPHLSIHEVIITHVIKKIEEYIQITCPSNLIMISLDGTPPVAKLEQQRQRRYKSWYTAKVINEMENKIDSPDTQFNTIEITTGTSFMKKLNESLISHFSDPTQYNVNKIVVSTSDDAGEGESKIYERIRSDPDVKRDSTCLVYGLDADLIMLSLNNLAHCPKIYLFRETPEFIKSIDSSLEPNENYVLDIPALSKNIALYMSNGKGSNINRTSDYIFICFLLGNDFLPHFPAVNIRTDGIGKILNAYRSSIGGTSECIIKDNKIVWKNVRKMLTLLANREEEYIITESSKRTKYEYRHYPTNTPEERFAKFNATPTYERGCEKYIEPTKPYWKDRYYDALFDIEIDDVRAKQISTNYLEGLEWTFKYYTTGCPDWTWFYKYHYPPLLSDLIKHVPYFETTFIPDTLSSPVSQTMQLCYVLPKSNLGLLPPKLVEKLLYTFPHWYGEDFSFHWAYCKYFWESHTQLPEIDLAELSMFLSRNKNLIST